MNQAETRPRDCFEILVQICPEFVVSFSCAFNFKKNSSRTYLVYSIKCIACKNLRHELLRFELTFVTKILPQITPIFSQVVFMGSTKYFRKSSTNDQFNFSTDAFNCNLNSFWKYARDSTKYCFCVSVMLSIYFSRINSSFFQGPFSKFINIFELKHFLDIIFIDNSSINLLIINLRPV